MPKNIIVFSDGTGQEGGKGNPTNVYKLFNLVEDRTERQIAFYDRGLGTDWRRITGNAFGVGISQNIQECYQFIFENYQAGDQIYLFGFSRGAFTVRSLSGFIHHFGILPKSRPELIKQAYKIYEIENKEKRQKQADALVKKHHTMWTTIKFIGVWDTVGALGVPYPGLDIIVDQLFKHEFHDTAISQAAECGYHALSIADVRLVFHPSLWDEKTEIGKVRVWQDGKKVEKEQIVEQVWFAGVHTDVGGGYVEQADPPLPAVSDITLEWMIKKALARGLLIYREDWAKTIKPDPLAELHRSDTGLARFYRKSSRENTKGLDKLKKLKVHQSVLDRHDADKGYDPWVLKKDHTVEPW